MRGDNRGAIQEPLGDPMLPGGIAGGFAPRRDLRHVDDRVHTGLTGSLSEIRRGLDQARADRVVEVGRGHADRRRTNGWKVQQISLDDFGALLT